MKLNEYADKRLNDAEKNDWQDFFYRANRYILDLFPYLIRDPVESILEVAGSFGDRARWFQLNTGAKVVCMDIKEHEHIEQDNVDYFIGDALNMPDIYNDTFDIVIGNGAISGGANPASKLLNECLRVSKLGVIFADQGHTNNFSEIDERATIIKSTPDKHAGDWGLIVVRKS